MEAPEKLPLSHRCEFIPARTEPVLRWVGGKRQWIEELAKFLPADVGSRPYREPFVGAASLFCWVGPKRAYLSDANQHLIQTYGWVKSNWKLVARYLSAHAKRTCEPYYYRIREQYNSGRFSAAQAARFIYLNKTCFNGIFRVNTLGKFNVPYGWKEPPALPAPVQLRALSELLSYAELRTCVFQEALKKAERGDFIYLDPPYPPLNGTAYFTHYTKDRFTTADQRHVASCFSHMDQVGCLVMMTNADTPLIRLLYKNFNVRSLEVTRYVSCKGARHTASELVITNY